MLKKDYTILFAIDSTDNGLKNIIKTYAHKVIELKNNFRYTIPAKKQEFEEIKFDLTDHLAGDEIVVTDGYWFGPKYQQAVKNAGVKLVCIVDFSASYFYPDVVINHAPGIQYETLSGDVHPQFYTGLEYCILRREFFEPLKISEKWAKDIFISFGGSDHYDLTNKICPQILNSKLFTKLHILTSDFYSAGAMGNLKNLQAEYPGLITLYNNISAGQLRAILDQCTYALAPASTILFECYSRGLICYTGYYTENQLNIYNGFVKNKLAIGMGNFRQFNYDYLNNTHGNINDLRILTQPLDSVNNIRNIFSNLC